jgi:hypothetical protein
MERAMLNKAVQKIGSSEEPIKKQVGGRVSGTPVEQVYQLYQFLRKIAGPHWTLEQKDEPIRKTVGRSGEV